jgi:hypothetical protein
MSFAIDFKCPKYNLISSVSNFEEEPSTKWQKIIETHWLNHKVFHDLHISSQFNTFIDHYSIFSQSLDGNFHSL